MTKIYARIFLGGSGVAAIRSIDIRKHLIEGNPDAVIDFFNGLMLSADYNDIRNITNEAVGLMNSWGR